MDTHEMFSSQTRDSRQRLWEALAVIWKYRWLELGLCLSVCLIVGGVSLLLHKEFDATASVMPPADPRTGGALERLALAGQTATTPSPIMGLLPGTATKDVFVGILKSRTMQDDVIKWFNLVKIYRFEKSRTPLLKARTKVQKMTNIKVSREGVISITASAYDPQMAADIANFYVENLDRLNTLLNITDAGRSRLFLEGRVAEAQKALREAEDRLRTYQGQSKAVVMEGQTKAAIEGAARLAGQIQAAEVQLRVVETYSTSRNPDVIKLKESIEEMQGQLRKMEYGSEVRGQRKGSDGGGMGAVDGRMAGFAMPLEAVPQTGTELVRLVREAKIQETIYTLLTQQLEQARIAEAKDTPTVRILDRAVPPEWKSRPSVMWNVLLAGALSVFASVCLAYILEGMGFRPYGGKTGDLEG